MKVIAFYLPQFHRFKENDEWWGEGFTEWTNTKKSIPCFKGHVEPKEPLNDFYYDLADTSNVMRWQIDLAKKYGVYGFCFYHYWFSDDHILMQKPLENFLNDKSLDIPFCISWANETWSRRWNGSDKDVLIEQTYGDKNSWIKHFNYMLPYFKDDRYIKFNEKPLFILYKPEIFDEYKEMFRLWNSLAKENGLDGLSLGAIWNNISNVDDELVDLRIMYEPGFTGCQNKKGKGLRIGISSRILRFKTKRTKTNINFQSYDAYCKNMLNRHVTSNKFVPGMFVGWDNTPRKGKNSTIFLGSNPNKFEKYMTLMLKKAKKEYKTDMVFVNAWNEWAEGCYLEPDKENKYEYLDALKRALDKAGD